MELLLWIGLFSPLVSFLILMLFSFSIKRSITHLFGCGSVLISFICFVSLLFIYEGRDLNPINFTLFSFLPDNWIDASWTLRIDPLSLFMTLIITGVGFLIHLYSIGYIEHEEDFARFFACMNFFVFSMLLLVLAANLLVLFVGWEGVGLASYLLIGYWYTRTQAAAAAAKAFVINRIGDLGFLLGLLLAFYTFQTGDFAELFQKAKGADPQILSILTLLLFIGAIGKSAQLPLQTWLPDAMEGPTPVSALIHAATMVTAGVYLVVRLHPLFLLTPKILYFVGALGGVTSLYAAVAAMGQTDLKKVLAYSTISQLGLMFLACGSGAFYAAMFHLMNHAFMKALLFLSAGNVVHMMRGITDMEKMGGLKKIFTKTHLLFLIGVLSMSGIPPLAAFFSKDLILEQEYMAGFSTLFYIALAASILTAYYLMRAYLLTFMGKMRLEPAIIKSVHEAPKIMLFPVAILAILAAFGGFFGLTSNHTPVLQKFLAEVGVTLSEPQLTGWEMITAPETLMSFGGALFGIGSALAMFRWSFAAFKNPPLILQKAFYINELYWHLFVLPLKKLADFFSTFFEEEIFAGSLSFLTRATQRGAQALQLMQSGQIRSYVAWMVLGSVCLIAYLLAKVT